MQRRNSWFGFAFLTVSLVAGTAWSWQPADGPLKTRWSRDVTPENVLSEYPRPQMVRKKWTNLNGLWQYAIRPAAEDKPQKWDGEILVPFAVESALSGVKKAVKPNEWLWYRRNFSPPALEKGERLLLHFGAVDWQCIVSVNGSASLPGERGIHGTHTGGYDPFTFDITDAIRPAGENEIVVMVMDPTDTGYQPRGKQVLKPHGIWYTAVTGIWQTVWLEAVPAHYIESLKIVPDVDRGMVAVTVNAPGGEVRVQVLDPASFVEAAMVKKEGKALETIELPLPNALLWSPARPFLYDLRVELLDGGKVTDTVNSNFGMRKIEVKKDAEGINRLWLNNKVLFQYGPLDQGWWPDGLYTAPTDEALKYDIEMTKRLGFNMVRKHVKVEPARWYYWCDRLGLLVWQDMPSGDSEKAAPGKFHFRRELNAVLDALQNHPSIVMWVPFNESWGQHDTPEIVRWIKDYDPTRPVNESSGWNDQHSGDVSDMHSYPGPGMREPEKDRVCVLGEFGGLGMPVHGHTWRQEKNWGYVSYDSKEKLTDAYVSLLTAMRPLIGRGLSAAVYTQTTDVEVEVNGLMTYDREILKMDEARIKAAAAKLYMSPPKIVTIVPASEKSPQTWHYTTTKPAASWFESGFDDTAWRTGPAGFGTEGTPGAIVRTKWDTPDIWLRRTFELKTPPEGGQLALNIHHDDDAEVYLNGSLLHSFKRHSNGYQLVILNHDERRYLTPGGNTLAVHCRQMAGGQYIDAGVVNIVESENRRE